MICKRLKKQILRFCWDLKDFYKTAGILKVFATLIKKTWSCSAIDVILPTILFIYHN